MRFLEKALYTVEQIFINIQNSKNERIINSVVCLQIEITQKIRELDQQEQDLKIKEVYLEKLQKLLQFASNHSNLKQVWKYIQFQVYSQQDQFIELVNNLPILIQNHLQKVMTPSEFVGQGCVELFSHQLVTFQIQLQLYESQLQVNSQQEDCVGCITYLSPEVQNQKLFKIVMYLRGFIKKVKILDSLLNTINLDAELLKLTLDYKTKSVTLWSQDNQVSYQITTKKTLDEIPQFEQRIYLHQDMVIQLTKSFQLLVNDCYNGNRKKGGANKYFTPLNIGDQQKQIHPMILNENMKWISLNNRFEDVIYYPNQIPLKISEYQTLPKGIEVLLQNDDYGHYITVVGDFSNFLPRIKSKRNGGQLLQFVTCCDNFNLGIIIQDNIRLQLSSNLLSVWNGTQFFDI